MTNRNEALFWNKALEKEIKGKKSMQWSRPMFINCLITAVKWHGFEMEGQSWVGSRRLKYPWAHRRAK